MKILITSPTGIVGQNIVPELLAPEFFVRVITNDPRKLPREIREQVDIVCGSIDDRRTLRGALEGVDALFWCVPPAPIHESNARNYDERLARAASVAICEAGTPRVISISPNSLSDFRVEEILNESGAAIRHIKCRFPMEEISSTAADELADLALRFLVRTDWSGIEVLSTGSKEIACDCTGAVVESF